jgi:hypothetical protein
MSNTPATDATTHATQATRRPYVRPTLTRYGDLAQLTQAKGRFGKNSDGALVNNNKTI